MRSILVSMSSEQTWGATASLQGSIQSLHEQADLHRTRANEAQAKWIAAQTKLNEISSVTNYVFHSEALAINEPLRKFAYAVARILDAVED